MRIVKTAYGKFPEISNLHRNFRKGIKRLKITLEIIQNQHNNNNNFIGIYKKLLEILPTLSQHKCCENWGTLASAPKLTKGIPLKKIGDATDIAHLIEHVIIDLQCHITDMKICSGITCGYQNPKYRYDLFVECQDKKIGIFAANLAVYLVSSLLYKKTLPHNFDYVIALAQYLYKTPRSRLNSHKLAAEIGWKKSLVDYVLKNLNRLNYFNHHSRLQ